MSRKDWSEYRRQEEIDAIEDNISWLEEKLDHLRSENWRKSFPKIRNKFK